MNLSIAATAVYAVLMLVGGVAGWAQARSTPSLIAGVVSAVLAALAAGLMRAGHQAGWVLAVALAIALALFGGRSWLVEHKAFMPRGLIFVLSVAELLALLLSRPF